MESPLFMSKIVRKQLERNYSKVQDKSSGLLYVTSKEEESVPVLKRIIRELKEERQELVAKLEKSRGVSKELMSILHSKGLIPEGQNLFSLFKDTLPSQEYYLDELKELYKTIKMDETTEKLDTKSRNILYLTENVLKARTQIRSKTLNKEQSNLPSRSFERWEGLKQAMIHIGKCKTYKELLLKLPKEIKSIAEYDIISIILINPELYKELAIEGISKLEEKDMTVKKVLHKGMWFNVLHLISQPYNGLHFKNKGELIAGRKKYFSPVNIVIACY
eukprot:TRINITY_DN3153_c0_g1_i4.p1 TRINITY_DN3153_c0_g1~~TRINITY_DN3153_c0_g1_i4.p1  ORF type:complete len:276 (+),score=76.09 TRINITY_DN3153_c0_g1_i4:382-1209(+)